jgi:hypothetical protein
MWDPVVKYDCAEEALMKAKDNVRKIIILVLIPDNIFILKYVEKILMKRHL